MKDDTTVDTPLKKNNKPLEIDPDTLIDIMERINSLSFEGQCQIIACLKAQVKQGKNRLKPLQRYFELKSIR